MDIKEVLRLHRDYLSGIDGGVRADLTGAYLSWADLYRADLTGANLYRADLFRADLSEANLSKADLTGAYLSGANLTGANLSKADLTGANLYRADLTGANLSEAKFHIGNDVVEINKLICQINERWHVTIFDNVIIIGCQTHKAKDWFSFTDKQISEMHSDALEWWVIWKQILGKIWKNGGVK